VTRSLFVLFLTWVAMCVPVVAADSARRAALGRDLNDRGQPRTNMEAVEAARDRGAGRIVDEDTWTLDRIDADQERRYVPGRESALFDQERDRQLRIDQRDRRIRGHVMTLEDQTDLGIAPGDIVRSSDGASPLSMQLYDDDRTLAAADSDLSRSLKQLDDAEARELKSLREKLDREGRGGDWDEQSARIRRDYATWRTQAEADRDRLRSRVLGAKPKLATTRPGPATKPTTEGSR
jgi:hypothetical protein